LPLVLIESLILLALAITILAVGGHSHSLSFQPFNPGAAIGGTTVGEGQMTATVLFSIAKHTLIRLTSCGKTKDTPGTASCNGKPHIVQGKVGLYRL
jgi:hypothetical protein